MLLPNPLDDFRSYSVHHVLLACRTTVAAEPFTDDSRNIQALDAINKTKKLGDKIAGHEDVFLVIDTRRFSQFSIENVKYEVLLNGLKNGQSHANFATELSMTILDSVGISFLNYMQWLLDSQMECNFDGLVFMLRTIFVGHLPDGTTTTVHSLTIPMHLAKFDLNLDFAKGAYNLEFWPNMNFNVDKQRRWTHIGQASTYFTGHGNNKLGPLIDSFEASLNERSQAFFDKVNGNNGPKKESIGRKVQYMITIPESWTNFEFTGTSEGAATETVFSKIKKIEDAEIRRSTPTEKANAKKVIDSHVSVKTGITITQVLDIVFSQVIEIKKMGNFKQSDETDGDVTFYKYITGITSDNTTVTVHVDVIEFKVPNRLAMESPKNTVKKQDSEFYREEGGKKIPRNCIEYDYIFTGKNKDILNFDLKIEDVQWLLANNLKVGAGEYFNINDNGYDNSEKKQTKKATELGATRRYDPILMPQTTKSEEINYSLLSTPTSINKQAYNISTSQEYTKNISKFYAASPIQTAITIKGNPLLFSKFSIGEVLSNATKPTNLSASPGRADKTDKAGYRRDLEERILKKNPNSFTKSGSTFKLSLPIDDQSYAATPIFVKINIKGPNVNDLTNEMFEGGNFSREVLTDVYFVVFKFTNIYESGRFTQELELWSHNVFSSGGEKLEKTTIGKPTKL